jgi:hypothetical protein
VKRGNLVIDMPKSERKKMLAYMGSVQGYKVPIKVE